jgi:uncharacterized protein (DUF983 family)
MRKKQSNEGIDMPKQKSKEEPVTYESYGVEVYCSKCMNGKYYQSMVGIKKIGDFWMEKEILYKCPKCGAEVIVHHDATDTCDPDEM